MKIEPNNNLQSNTLDRFLDAKLSDRENSQKSEDRISVKISRLYVGRNDELKTSSNWLSHAYRQLTNRKTGREALLVAIKDKVGDAHLAAKMMDKVDKNLGKVDAYAREQGINMSRGQKEFLAIGLMNQSIDKKYTTPEIEECEDPAVEEELAAKNKESEKRNEEDRLWRTQQSSEQRDQMIERSQANWTKRSEVLKKLPAEALKAQEEWRLAKSELNIKDTNLNSVGKEYGAKHRQLERTENAIRTAKNRTVAYDKEYEAWKVSVETLGTRDGYRTMREFLSILKRDENQLKEEFVKIDGFKKYADCTPKAQARLEETLNKQRLEVEQAKENVEKARTEMRAAQGKVDNALNGVSSEMRELLLHIEKRDGEDPYEFSSVIIEDHELEQLVNLAEKAGLTGLDDLRPGPEAVRPWDPSEPLHGARVRSLVEELNDEVSRRSEFSSMSAEDVKRELGTMLQRAGYPSENIEGVVSRWYGEGDLLPEFLE